jgi:hypothetical protein
MWRIKRSNFLKKSKNLSSHGFIEWNEWNEWNGMEWNINNIYNNNNKII